MPAVANLRTLLDWAPVAQFVIAINSAPNAKERVFRTLELLDWLAAKTPSPIDNELIAIVRNILLTPQGSQLLDYLVAAMQPLFYPEVKLEERP